MGMFVPITVANYGQPITEEIYLTENNVAEIIILAILKSRVPSEF